MIYRIINSFPLNTIEYDPLDLNCFKSTVYCWGHRDLALSPTGRDRADARLVPRRWYNIALSHLRPRARTRRCDTVTAKMRSFGTILISHRRGTNLASAHSRLTGAKTEGRYSERDNCIAISRSGCACAMLINKMAKRICQQRADVDRNADRVGTETWYYFKVGPD